MKITRWGQSAYETDDDIAREVQGVTDLGGTMSTHPQHEHILPEDTEGLVVTSKVQVSASVMQALPKLRFVLTSTSGYDHIDREYAHAHNIVVGRCPLARRDAVVSSSIAMGLSLVRSIPSLHSQAQEGTWARASLPQRNIKNISDLSVGLIGYGIIGRAAFRVWTDLGAKVRWYDPHVLGSFPLEELLPISDILSLHCAYTESSHGIINAQTLNWMPSGSILLNTARGECVDMDALIHATHLGGYGLDVFPQEPPENLSDIAAHPNSIVLPHAAGYHNGLGEAVSKEVVDSVRMWMDDRRLPHTIYPDTNDSFSV